MRNATLAKPRGPNQPTNRTVDQCSCLPQERQGHSQHAHDREAQKRVHDGLPTKSVGEQDRRDGRSEDEPDCEREQDARPLHVFDRLGGCLMVHGSECDAGYKGRDEPVALECEGAAVGQQREG